MNSDMITITAQGNSQSYWRELWQYRNLLYRFTWKDVILRYRQTIVGVGWIIARPVLTMVVLVIVFGKLAKLSSEGVPYPLFVFAALLPWQFFTAGLAAIASSLVGNSHLINKIYFPRLIIPLSSVGPCLIDFVLAFVLFFGLFWYFEAPLLVNMLCLPLFLLLAVGAVVGPGLLLASLSVRYRDVIQGIPFIIQFGLYVSPVGYGSHVVPEEYKLLYSLNPMAGIIDGFRWCLLGIDPYWPGIYLAVAMTLLSVVVGVWYFRRCEATFADTI